MFHPDQGQENQDQRLELPPREAGHRRGTVADGDPWSSWRNLASQEQRQKDRVFDAVLQICPFAGVFLFLIFFRQLLSGSYHSVIISALSPTSRNYFRKQNPFFVREFCIATNQQVSLASRAKSPANSCDHRRLEHHRTRSRKDQNHTVGRRVNYFANGSSVRLQKQACVRFVLDRCKWLFLREERGPQPQWGEVRDCPVLSLLGLSRSPLKERTSTGRKWALMYLCTKRRWRKQLDFARFWQRDRPEKRLERGQRHRIGLFLAVSGYASFAKKKSADIPKTKLVSILLQRNPRVHVAIGMGMKQQECRKGIRLAGCETSGPRYLRRQDNLGVGQLSKP